MSILITGYAGTLGSAFVRHFIGRGNSVVGVDSNEWAAAAFPPADRLEQRLGDFDEVRGTFDLVVHCAAYKHVDLIESNREAAFLNNVERTVRLYNRCKGPVLFVSTDKAVEPSSYYGELKKYGEYLTRQRGGHILRLGNLAGSSGSVIPKWEKCISDLAPLPLTDPAMTRYLIDPDEAVEKAMRLFEQVQEPGDVIVPEMGAPVPLKSIAERVLRGMGFEDGLEDGVPGTGYPWKVVGRRRGEKTHEKLRWDDEEVRFESEDGVIVREGGR